MSITPDSTTSIPPLVKTTEQTTKPSPANISIDPICYQRAEKKALWYLKDLQQLTYDPRILTTLAEDYREWYKNHAQQKHKPGRFSPSLSELEEKESRGEGVDSWSFLEKLSADRKLKNYLEKSVTYIFMRDLGKPITAENTQRKIQSTVSRLQRWVVRHSSSNQKSKHTADFSYDFLFNKTKSLGIEETYFWLLDKLAQVRQNMPADLDATQGMRKLVKIIAGVVMHQLVDMPTELPKHQQSRMIADAIKLGYCYGLTYPFIDDLQDSAGALSESEKQVFNQAIRDSLLQGEVVPCPVFSQANQHKMQFIYRELAEAFETIKQHQSPQDARQFFERAFIFFEAQDIDRQRKLGSHDYSMESLFMPIILKSSGCRLVAKELLSDKGDSTFNYHTFCFGIYNQFNDDIKDIFDDISEHNVTPYTYYLQRQKLGVTTNLDNPYRFYWSVVFYLIKQVYQDQPLPKQLLLERSINAHKSLHADIGAKRYAELRRSLLTTGNKEFDQLIDQLVAMPSDVAWFDKLVSRQVADFFRDSKNKQAEFESELKTTQAFINDHLALYPHSRLKHSTLIDAGNYSLKAGGKRLRPVLAMMICQKKYQIPQMQCIPVIQLLEYMHTASIIFDDKPSQDNADLRRGKAALHRHYDCEATAELAGISMMMRAVEVQSKMQGFDAENVLASLAYAANTTQAICEGQLMDIRSKSQRLSLQQLELMSELKTGLAIEAALIIPAILAGENDIDKGHIKQFARHLGLAFQIKDDLLDQLGDQATLGKPVAQDSDLNKASFVTCLGVDGARKKLFEHYQQASENIKHLGEAAEFMRQLLEYVIFRDK